MTISGHDAKSFLQGQTTCDIDQLDNQQATLAACCERNGRMIANFWLWQKDAVFYCLLPKSMQSIIHDHWKKYSLFSTIQINDESEQWHIFTVLNATTDLAIKPYQYITKDQTTFLTTPWQPQQIFVITPLTQNVQALLAHYFNLTHHQLDQNDNQWIATTQQLNTRHLLEIEQGFCWITPKTSGLFTPQMIQLEKFHGISFTKGCYLGQEVIARTQHLGQLKRHLYRITIDHPELSIEPGQHLINEQQQTVGIVTHVATDLQQRISLLAVIQDRAIDSPIRIGMLSGYVITHPEMA